jgi:hypothetical protein
MKMSRKVKREPAQLQRAKAQARLAAWRLAAADEIFAGLYAAYGRGEGGEELAGVIRDRAMDLGIEGDVLDSVMAMAYASRASDTLGA